MRVTSRAQWAEAISLLDELAGDDYIDLIHGREGLSAGAGIVGVVYRREGRAAIMEIPDPNAELVRRLEVIAEAIEERSNVDPAEKRRSVAAARAKDIRSWPSTGGSN